MRCRDCGKVFFNCCDDVPYCYDCEKRRVDEKLRQKSKVAV